MTDDKLKALRYAAPEDLRNELTELVRGTSGRKRQIVVNVDFGNWLGFALGVAAVLIALVWTHTGGQQKPDDLILREVADGHIRSMMEDHIFDVASTDQHTVKPWFGGRVDFSPKVVDLANAGFALIGGRLDYLGGHPVAALVYKHERHVINVFTWPAAEAIDGFKFASSQGFNIWHWTENGMNFYAVSDMSANGLKEFAEKLRG